MKAFKTMCLALGILTTVCFSGCIPPKLSHPRDYYGEREVGDFVVYFASNDTCEVTGTTDQGNTKKLLFVPKQIEDSIVQYLGRQTFIGADIPKIESDVLEKIYIESEVKLGESSYNPGCPNLKKIICLSEWKTPHQRKIWNSTVYYPNAVCEDYNQGKPEFACLVPANVSYYYNYENGENNGYYWVDDCDYGGKIEYIPSDPVREGYTFGGWYKEEECLNKWDFETDTLPEEKTELKEGDFDEYEYGLETVEIVVYQETILYAKWIEEV